MRWRPTHQQALGESRTISGCIVKGGYDRAREGEHQEQRHHPSVRPRVGGGEGRARHGRTGVAERQHLQMKHGVEDLVHRNTLLGGRSCRRSGQLNHGGFEPEQGPSIEQPTAQGVASVAAVAAQLVVELPAQGGGESTLDVPLAAVAAAA